MNVREILERYNKGDTVEIVGVTLTIDRVIGRGGSSVVFMVSSNEGYTYSLKIIHDLHAPRSLEKKLYEEICIYDTPLAPIYSCNQVMNRSREVEPMIGVLMRHFTMSASNFLELQRELKPSDIITIMVGVIEGLEFLHSIGIAHCDVKPDNILIDVRSGIITEARLCDMGLVRRIGSESDRYIYTSGYDAPEIGNRERIRVYQSLDIWALGSTLFTLCTNRPFYTIRDSTDETDPDKIVEMATARVSPQFSSIIRDMMKTVAINRPSLEEVYDRLTAST